MAKSWFLDGIAIARSIKASGLPSEIYQHKDSLPNWECPQCRFKSDNCNAPNEWPGLPVGVKFDPSDAELLEHLAAKCGAGNGNPNPFIDVFIPTLDVDEGICYKHPENLPGSRKDGNSFHFFYRTTNAYTTGHRKRRKIYSESSSTTTDVRWHKTGKTKAILKNGVHIGFKKIMVLYGTSVGGSKPCKINWVMHQFHLGTNEEEKDGEYVVAKIFFQAQKMIDNTGGGAEESDSRSSLTSPTTPMINVPHPPRSEIRTPAYEDITTDDSVLQSLAQAQESEFFEQKYNPSSSTSEVIKDELKPPACEDNSKDIDWDTLYNSIMDQGHLGSNVNTNNAAGNASATSVGTTGLENLDLDSLPDFSLVDVYFSPEDSLSGWLDRL
ncbi:NAC domain-containing protein [Artemisia annua]|uniref:NAC domain-containing protein n=1 Tax=Artemisia annua TaxID=35608 RepID=A0A2U1MSE5_ARTAN|nr:NAC domain-containing protein [Artemisia annua]